MLQKNLKESNRMVDQAIIDKIEAHRYDPPRERKVAIMVLARMYSDRLPGKSILPLAGKPLWWHVMQRCEAAVKLMPDVKLAGATLGTSMLTTNDALATSCVKHGYECYRNEPEEDIPGLRLGIMDRYGVDVLIEGSGDSPFSWYEHIPSMMAPIWTTGFPAVMKWTRRDRDPAYMVTQVTGALGYCQRGHVEMHRVLAEAMDEWQAPFWITQRRPHLAAILGGRPMPPNFVDLPDEYWDLYRWWCLEVDTYPDALTAQVLYSMFYDPATKMVDARASIKYLDLHPEVHYNIVKEHSHVNELSYRVTREGRDKAWLDYCELYGAPAKATKIYCTICNEYMGYVTRSHGADKLHRPDGSVITGNAVLACSRGHAREWHKTA
jgi:hypothetical protein